MVKLLQKYHYEKNYFYSVGGGAIAPIAPPMDPPLRRMRRVVQDLVHGRSWSKLKRIRVAA